MFTLAKNFISTSKGLFLKSFFLVLVFRCFFVCPFFLALDTHLIYDVYHEKKENWNQMLSVQEYKTSKL